jgi:hypothetical protein
MKDGAITGRVSAEPSPEDPCSFTVTAIDEKSGKKVCAGEFRYTVSE